jgi:hypothetical protein
MTADWMATKYHIHADFGTITLQFKQTPDHKIVVRAWSKYSYVVLGEDYVRDASGNPIEFRTGTYLGNTTCDYYGQTLNHGDLYQNKFVISKAKAVNGQGFVTRVWVNDCLGLEVYDPNMLGGEGKFSHFLIDNISGTTLTAYSLVGIESYRNDAIARLENFNAENYSAENLIKIQGIVDEAKTHIQGLDFIASIQEYTEAVLAKMATVWTKDEESAFASKKTEYVSSLTGLVANNAYEEAENAVVQALLTKGISDIQSATEADGFIKLSVVYQEYFNKIASVMTVERKAEIVAAQAEAKAVLEEILSQFKVEDYTSENFAQLAEIRTKYIEKIENCTDVAEIEMLPYLAQSEMWTVETITQPDAKAAKTAFGEPLADAKNKDGGREI